MQDVSKQIAKFLLKIGAVKFNVSEGFIWASGIRSPIYCDNRIINSKVEVRDAVINAFTDIISNKYLNKTDIIAAVATGGIAYGILAADRLKLPFIYVREERKQHGLMKLIEGEYQEGDRVVLIEDNISTGSSSLKAIKALQDAGLEVVCLLSIMTYGFKTAEDSYASKNIKHESICNLNVILEVAQQEGIINSHDRDTILQFRSLH